MVLTHVDTSDLGDPDSLLFILADKNSTPDHKSDVKEFKSPSSSSSTPTSTSTPRPPPNTPSNPADVKSVFDVQPLVFDESKFQDCNQPSSEKPSKGISVTSSQQDQPNFSSSSNRDSKEAVSHPPKSAKNFPEIFIVPSTSGTTLNKTGIDINVIQPSPDPNAGVDTDSAPSVEIPSQIRPVKFVFSPNTKSTNVQNSSVDKERRNTSTPISSPAIALDLTAPGGEEFDEIFETEINTTGPISPIKCDKKIPPGEL